MKKNLKKQNIIQLTLALIIVLLINYISSNAYFRLDLTADKRYTLNKSSREILDSLNDIVYIEIYLDGEMPVGFQRMQKSVRELMDEFRVIANDNIQFSFINPSESADQKKRNVLFQDLYDRGLNPTNVKDRDTEGGMAEKMLFPGAIIAYQGKETPVNLLKNNPGLSADENLNNSIESLEYEFIDAIRKITVKQRKRIAFIEGQGELDEFQTGDITKALSEYYDIDRVTIKDFITILEPYDAIIIAGPTEEYTEKSKFIIDQYLMKGGRILWLIDAVKADMDSLSTGSATFAFYNDPNLGDQLFKYGVRVNPDIIQDIQCAVIPVNTAITGNQPRFAPAPWVYFPLLNPPSNNPITKNLNMIKAEFPSVIDTVGNNPDIRKKIILTSSQNCRVLTVPQLVSLEQVREQIDPYTFNQSYKPVALLLEGKFESVFTNRLINEYTGNQPFEFKNKSLPTQMIVISDADIIRNDVRQRADGVFLSPLGYDRYTKQSFGNKEFVMNTVHYLVEKNGILDIRSRDFKLRLLDKSKLITKKTKWQLINTVLPVVSILLFGFILLYIRKRKYM
ncbi:MAG: gliding motility-associated ABC transporter substrate-binding protein GldG [Bacteroidetes bacterium GWC2_33_15]|nr:MAG: gliding motility-associated ABC transporter substrate-binding protein GldG [Bacteroidetes bacterium GWA2_33_15]OFX51026.1 MAG: gliding motility-associated ABC transporter substrate-binding protein GldG [Bacteroidetes bacterium GWC2_33_15]OFX65649.1 MAG: gliding motility-associated ABC transporter substrate-binding protein GldG [Bacteroidetes bacterium GWB2_32_14]OFX70234.1 MAG: gliding motility-associated ABC transporter substrate-binding protein GldG [Bacteroidetes bacterium GWD2_33_33]